MKIFIDTANLDEIRKANEWGIIDGVTTNPTLVAKENKDFKEIVREIIRIVDGPISVEVISTDVEGMIKEAVEMSEWSQNIVVKIPMIPEGLKAVKILNGRNVKTNITLIFSVNQALLAAKAGATYVSPFIGRLDDIGHDGMQIVRDMVNVFKLYNFKTEIIVASIRHPLHVIEAAKAGAHVATIPFNVIEKMFAHPLTDIGLERFLSDWGKVPNR
ncbi:MAG: fructose-6-phosphate aldolase [Candidatus Methanoperedens sp.]|nr:fructose-6-phosphate aldolase [Candidatus Methanoperedens sp.]